MLKADNSLKKFIAVIIVISMLACSLLITPASAEKISTETMEIDGITYTVITNSGQTTTNIYQTFYKLRETPLSEKETDELAEALQEYFELEEKLEKQGEEYQDYEIIVGKDFEMKRIPLKYGYSITVVSNNDGSLYNSLLNNSNFDIPSISRWFKGDELWWGINDPAGGAVCYVQLSARFDITTNSSGQAIVLLESAVFSQAAPSPSYWYNLSYSNWQTATGHALTAVPYLYFVDSYGNTQTIKVSMLMHCDTNGNITKSASGGPG